MLGLKRKAPETAGCLSPARALPQKLCNFSALNICIFVFVWCVFVFVFTCGSLHQSFYSSSLCQFSPFCKNRQIQFKFVFAKRWRYQGFGFVLFGSNFVLRVFGDFWGFGSFGKMDSTLCTFPMCIFRPLSVLNRHVHWSHLKVFIAATEAGANKYVAGIKGGWSFWSFMWVAFIDFAKCHMSYGCMDFAISIQSGFIHRQILSPLYFGSWDPISGSGGCFKLKKKMPKRVD